MPPTLSPTRRKRRQNRAARRAQAKANPPADKPAGYVVVSAPVATPAPDPSTLPADLLLSREMAYATCAAIKLETWLNDHHYAGRTCGFQREAVVCQRCPGKMCPLSTCVVGATVVPILLEAWLKVAILFPELLPRAVEEENDDAEFRSVVSARDARRDGYAFQRSSRPGEHKPVPTLPGCRGVDEDGAACARLRRYGEKFCIRCAKKERERMREEAT